MRQIQDDAPALDEPLWLPDAPAWPPDDSEESVVGSEYHQHVIDAARDGLRMAAEANGAPWRALSQVPLAGFRRRTGTPYPLLPDVFVHPLPNPHPDSGEHLTFAEVGVPLLAIEVLSASTWRSDVDTRRGKAWSYADAGVAAYIIVDHAARYIPQHVRALRLSGRRWAPWRPNARGQWEDAALGVSFEFDGLYLRVRDAAGELMPLPHEAYALLTTKDAQLAFQAARLAERDARLAERDARLAERDARLATIEARAQAQAAALEQARILAATGDVAALQAFLTAQAPSAEEQ